VFGAALAGAAGDVIPGALIVAHADERDGVEGAVEAPVAAAVEPAAGDRRWVMLQRFAPQLAYIPVIHRRRIVGDS
jgi:hypothetical protein